MTDLADFVHFVTRLKYVPQAADDAALSEAERKRGADFARDLSVRALGRAWQILVKGIAEVEASERALPAADMVLVRLAHAASLPAPDEVIRALEDGASPAPARPSGAPAGNGGSNGSHGASASHGAPAQPVASQPAGEGPRASLSQTPATMAARRPDPSPQPSAQQAGVVETIALGSFEDLIVLCEDKRDIRLRTSLKRHVRLIEFADGKLQFAIAGNPPPNFVQDLSRKLQEWTGRRWMVATSREGGQPTIEEVEQAEANERTEMARANPAVDAIMNRFPGARIIDVKLRRPEPEAELPEDPESDIGNDAGLDDFFE